MLLPLIAFLSRLFQTSVFQSFSFSIFLIGESKLGRLVDALALGGDEGRDKLR